MIQHILDRFGTESERLSADEPPITIEVVTDVVELAKAREQDERFEKNWAWFTAHAEEIYRTQRGKCLCISEQELFVGDTPAEAIAQAKAAYPDDDGRFTRMIPREKLERIYAHSGRVVPL